MLGDVHARIKDGGLGITQLQGEGVHFKIGPGSKNHGKILTITAFMEPEAIAARVGDTPLYHAVMDSLAMGCRMIHVIPVNASTEGSISQVKKTMTGQGSVFVEGKPINDYEVTLEFLDSGGFNEATYSFSLDGDNFTAKRSVPLDGVIDLGIGVTVRLSEHSEKAQSFLAGDKIEFSCIAPKMSNQDVLTAVRMLKSTKLNFEYAHIVGESKKPLWAAMAVEAQEFFDKWKKPIFFVFEAADKTEQQTLDEYTQALLTEKSNVVSWNIQVTANRVEFTAKDGKIRNTPLSNIVCGLYSRAKVNTSIGKVEEFPLNGVLKLLPEGIDDYIEILDEAGYTTARQYLGLEGFYISNARSFANPVSDYIWMEHVRTVYKAIRMVRRQALYKMHMEIDPSEMETEVIALEKFLEIPLDRMVVDKEISRAKVTIDPNQNILGTSELKAKVSIVPMGTLRNLILEFGLVNPYLQQKQGGK
ncbi:MAG: DUF2586 domain-containing protein [Peptostreptococcaceae bacterium]|nr:DUF2586 domain-containing protein [Peptostreptococcaceae bacterium]